MTAGSRLVSGRRGGEGASVGHLLVAGRRGGADGEDTGHEGEQEGNGDERPAAGLRATRRPGAFVRL